MSWVGRSVPRLEDPRLLTGNGRFIDDLDLPGQVYMRVVRSPIAHGRIVSIDTTAAAQLSGVLAVLTAATLPPGLRIPIRLAVDPRWLVALDPPDATQRELADFLQPILADEFVRYVGEPLAAVVAIDPYIAEDAAELVFAEIEPLPAVTDAEQALTPGSPTSWGDRGNEAARLRVGYGDIDAAFTTAAHVISTRVKAGRHAAVPLECRGLLASPAADGGLDLWGPTKVPNFNRRLLGVLLERDPASVHIHTIDAGGGFGARGEFYPEDFLVPYLALHLGRPVKWIEDRAENLVALNHSREQLHEIALAFDADGRIVGLRDEIWHDNGAYLRTHGVAVPELTVTMLPGPYRVPAYDATIHVALTNKTPCGTYRAPGRYEGTFAREHLLDIAADGLGIDRVEIRRRNLLTPAELPHDRPITALNTPMLIDRGDFPGLLDRALGDFDYAGWQREAAAARAQGAHRGTGLAVFMEKSGLGPHDTATASLGASGQVTVVSGGTSIGQGIETAMAQIAADELGVEPASIRVVHTESDLSPDGTGSWASRSTVVGGSAVLHAARRLAERVREVASQLLEATPAEIVLADGRAAVPGSPVRAVSLAEVARAARDPLSETYRFEVDHMTYPYGVHLADVEIDPETNAVRLRRFAVAYEVGRAVNPKLVEGQVAGGAVQGIGGALFEEFAFDGEGQPQSATFIDYLLPALTEIPPIESIVTQDYPPDHNPLGVRGAGEAGITGAGAAIANAVRDALGIEGAVPCLPITPALTWALRRGEA